MAKIKEDDAQVDQSALERARSYAIDCKEYSDYDDEKIFTIRLSKPTKVSLSGRNKEGKTTQEIIELPEGQDIEVDIVVLREVVTRAVQEGPPTMRNHFFTRNGNPLDPRPLFVLLVGEKLRPGSGFSYTAAAKKLSLQGVPTLVEG